MPTYKLEVIKDKLDDNMWGDHDIYDFIIVSAHSEEDAREKALRKTMKIHPESYNGGPFTKTDKWPYENNLLVRCIKISDNNPKEDIEFGSKIE